LDNVVFDGCICKGINGNIRTRGGHTCTNVNSYIVSYWARMYLAEKVANLSHSTLSPTFVCHFVLHSGWTDMLPSNCAVWKGLHFMVVWIALIVSIAKVQPISEKWHKERAFFSAVETF